MENYLYHQYRQLPDSRVCNGRMHSHACWQVELFFKGHGNCSYYDAKKRIQSIDYDCGDIVVIPSDLAHGFVYESSRESWLSVKFTSHHRGDRVCLFRDDSIVCHAIGIIQAALSPEIMSQDTALTMVNAGLSVIMGRYGMECNRHPDSEFVQRIKMLVYSRQGRFLSVSEIGESLGCTGKHAALRFQQETGIPLKVYLDQRRGEVVASLLSTGDESLSEIAERLEFRDVYALSRFFRRMAHESPTSYVRRKLESR